MKPLAIRAKRTEWASWLVLALVIVLTLKTTYGMLGTFDVGLDDETLYLEGAHWLGKRFLPLAESTPLYPAWYRLIAFFEPDMLRVYFVNWFILTASLPILLYALARRSGAPLLPAAVVAIAWSMSGTLLTWPFVSKFAAVVLGVSALLATMTKDRRVAAAITVVAMSLASYARAELATPALAFAGIVALIAFLSFVRTVRWNAGRRRTSERWRSFITFVACVLAPILFRKIFGDPPALHGRAFFAFGQHYALNVVEDRHLYVDPWTNWVRYVREVFPTATTIEEALKENPTAFLWHIKRNATTWLYVPKLLRPLPYVPPSIAFVVIAALMLVAFVGVIAILFVRREKLDPRLIAWLPLFLMLAIATAGSTLLIYPREHYVLPFLWFGLALLAAACKRIHLASWLTPRWWLRLPRSRASILVALLLIALLVALPTRRPVELWPRSLLASAEVPPPSLVQENVRTIEVLRGLHLQGRVVILESDHSRAFYADLDYQRIAQWDKALDEPFWKFVDRFFIRAVVINNRLRWDERFRDDPAFKGFIAGRGERPEFVLIPVPETSVVLAVHRALLPR